MSRPLSPKSLPALIAIAARATAIEDEVAAALRMTFAPVGAHERTRTPGHRRVRDAAREHPALWRRWREGEALRWQIALTLRGILYGRACSWYGPQRGPDVASEALEYLFAAAVSWEPTRGAWTTHARSWMRVGLQRGARSNTMGIELTGRLSEAMGRISGNPNRPLEDLADNDVSLDMLRRARDFRVMSLDRRIANDEGESERWADRLPDDGPPTDEQADHDRKLAQIANALRAVEIVQPRAVYALTAYYGSGQTHAAIGRAMPTQVSRERVRQLCSEGTSGVRYLLGLSDGSEVHHRVRAQLREAAG